MASQGESSDNTSSVRTTVVVEAEPQQPCMEEGDSTSAAVKSGQPEVDSQIQAYVRPKAFRKLSNASSIISEIFHHPDVAEDKIRGKIKRDNDRETSRDLIDFLNNTPPPTGNNLSVPAAGEGNPGETEKTKRPIFWTLRKKLKASKATKVGGPTTAGGLKRPTSAIPGRTSNGKPYLAIVPHEYMGGLNATPGAVFFPELSNLGRSVATFPNQVPEIHKPVNDSAIPASPPIHNGQIVGGSLLSPDQNLESWSDDASREAQSVHPRIADTSVGAQSSTSIASPKLTTPCKGSSFTPVTGGSASRRLSHRHSFSYGTIRDQELLSDGVFVQRHRKWVESSVVSSIGNLSTAENVVTDDSDRVSSGETPTRRCCSPIVEPPPANLPEALGTDDAETVIYDPEPDLTRRQSAVTVIQGSAASLDQHRSLSRMMSFADLLHGRQNREHGDKGDDADSSGSEDAPTRFHTPDFPPAYQLPLGTGAMGSTLDMLTSKPETGNELRFTPVMTVAEVEPSSPVEPDVEQDDDGEDTPRGTPSIVRGNTPIFTADYLDEEETDYMTPIRRRPRGREPASQQSHARVPTITLTNNSSLERIMLSRRPAVPSTSTIFEDQSRPAFIGRSTSAQYTTSISTPPPPPPPPPQPTRHPRHRSVTQTESHRELSRQYEELRESRGREIETMLERIERLEANNGRLLNVILPMVEAMTQQQLPHDYSSTQPRPRHEGLLSRADDSDDDDIDPLREHRDQNEELEDYDLDVRDSRGYDGFSSPQHHGPRQHGFSNVAARPQRGPHNIPRRVASRNAFGLYTTSQSSGDFDQYIPQRAASRNATRPYTASQSSGDFGTNTSASVHRPYTRRGSLNISSRSNWELGTNDLPAVAAFDHPPTTRQGGGRYTLHSNREFDTNPIATPINRPPTRHGGESYNTTASHSNWELNTNNPIAAAAATSRPPTRHGRSPTSNGGSNFASRMAAAVRRQQSSRGSQQELTTTDNNDGYDDNDLTGLDTLEPVMRDLLTSERDLTSEMEIVQEEDDDDDDEEAMLGWGI